MFDGAKVFGIFTVIAGVGLFLAWGTVGGWGLLGAAVGLYFLLSFCNSLERRDINDAEKKREQNTKRKGKRRA